MRLMSNVRRRQYSAAVWSSACSLPSCGLGSQSRSRCGSLKRLSKASANAPKQVQSLRHRKCGRSVLRRPAHDRSARKQNNTQGKQVLAAQSPQGAVRPGHRKAQYQRAQLAFLSLARAHCGYANHRTVQSKFQPGGVAIQGELHQWQRAGA